MDFKPRVFLDWVEGDSGALDALHNHDKKAYLARVRARFPEAGRDDDGLFCVTFNWIGLPKCPPKTVGSGSRVQNQTKSARTSKRHFIKDSGLNVSDAAREAFLASLPVHKVKPLDSPYPPFKEIISENEEIHEKWQWYFAHGKQPDARKERLPVRALDPESIVLDIGPEIECANNRTRWKAGRSCRCATFAPSEEATAWADAAVQAQLPHRRNIRVRLKLHSSFMFILIIYVRWKIQENLFRSGGQQALAASLLSIG